MDSVNTPIMPQAASPPPAVKAGLLLAEFCPVKAATLRKSLDPKWLVPHAARVAIVLKQIFHHPGWSQGGLND